MKRTPAPSQVAASAESSAALSAAPVGLLGDDRMRPVMPSPAAAASTWAGVGNSKPLRGSPASPARGTASQPSDRSTFL